MSQFLPKHTGFDWWCPVCLWVRFDLWRWRRKMQQSGEGPPESPNFRPKELDDFEASGFQRKHRHDGGEGRRG